MDPLKIKYEFHFPDGITHIFSMELHPETLSYLPKKKMGFPEWTQLEVEQCENCPLQPATSPHCPIAANLSQLVENFDREKSYSEAKITVTTPERNYMKTAPVQVGLFSIFGVIMATSDCPVMTFLKPMARFHLPFSSEEETIVRSVSFYLLRQYYAVKAGKQPDLDLKKLDEKYGATLKVNKGMLQRIRKARKGGDANLNAVTLLDTFAQLLSMEISTNLDSYQYLFQEE